MEVSYTIQMAAKISGVGVHTIRAWEKRYKAIVPRRDNTGHRVYSKEDIEKLILLGELCLLGYSISKISNNSIPELKEQLKLLGKAEDSIKSLEMSLYNTDIQKVDSAQALTILLMALKSYKLDIVTTEINKLKLVMNPRDFALDIVMPIMSELGMAVHRGEFTIIHEHAISAILKFHVGHILFQPKENLEKSYFNIIVCGIEQDLHEFGLLVAALIGIHYQYNIIYLGPNMPAESLVDAAKFLDANMVVLGATQIVSSFGNNYLNNYLSKVINGLDSKTEFILGSNLPIDLSLEQKKRVKQLKSLEEFDQYLSQLK
jgi:DNA-binding transcriptional MerR regulator